MMWKKCNLIAAIERDKDQLGNPVVEYKVVREIVARFSPWDDKQMALEGREVTKNEQWLVVPIEYKEFPICQFAEIDGIKQEIINIIDLCPRYSLIQVRIHKK